MAKRGSTAKLAHLTRMMEHQNDKLQAQIAKSQGVSKNVLELLKQIEKQAMRKRRRAKRR